MQQKTCSNCKISKPLTDFYKAKGCKQGRLGRCKVCKEAEVRIRRANNPQKFKDYQNKHNRKRKKERAAWYLENKERLAIEHRNYYNRSKEKTKARELKKSYNITLDQYLKMLLEQDNKCAICKRPEKAIHFQTKEVRRLAVDHCHKTGSVRDLLCSSCNRGIGSFEDNIEFLTKAIEYLTKHES